MIYFTSDHHFEHRNIISYCKRGYESAHEMNEDLIRIWNETITRRDEVYYLGDFGLGSKEVLKSILKRLNFKRITLVKGNHDKCNKAMLEIGFTEVHKYMDLKLEGKTLFLSHVPMVSCYHDICICGHVHDKFQINGNIFNVGVDANGLIPVSKEDLFVKYWQSLNANNFLPMNLEVHE